IGMGAASSGPLLIRKRSTNPFPDADGGFELLDIQTLRPLPRQPGADGAALGQLAEYSIRASADGRVFGLKEHQPQQRNLVTIVCNDANVQLHQHCVTPEEPGTMYLMPGPDGKVLYTAMGRFSERLEPLGPAVKDGPMFVPAEHGDYYLSVEADGH